MRRILWTGLVIAVATASMAANAGNKKHGDDGSSDDGSKDRSTVCERTAGKMFESCRFEVNEEFFATTAKCINFGDAGERRDCKQEARETRKEDRKGCREQREAREDACDGSFEAGRDLAKSGILIKAVPMTGDSHRQEYLPGEAEDLIRYVAGVGDLTSVGPGEGGENPNFPCGGACVKTEELIPPEPGAGEFKYFIAGTGFVLGVGLEDGEPDGERDELLCVGESLDVLEDDPDCGLNGDPVKLAELQDLLCELSPIAFCD